MAMTVMPESWNGIRRMNSNYNIESCYKVYTDPADNSVASYLSVDGFSIYTDSRSNLTALLPITVTVQIEDGKVYRYTSGDIIREGVYSPSLNWMPYAVTITSSERMLIQVGSGQITIHVTVTPNGGSTYSFSEDAYKPLKNTITPPDLTPPKMVTGRVYSFALGNYIQAGDAFLTTATLQYAPIINNVPVVSIIENGYVDPYTKTNEASSDFNTVQFVVRDPSIYIDNFSETLTGTAYINVQTRYLSHDFTNGILILDLSSQMQLDTRAQVDEELRPELTDSLVDMTGTNVINTGHDAFVHKQSVITITPNAKFKYGDTFAYIRHDDNNSFSRSISKQAFGVEPGQTYTNPITGTEEAAGEETIGSTTISVYGSKWGLESSRITKTYNIIWYHTPTVSGFTVHRASRVSNATSYKQGDYYYIKDDFGLYCIVEYSIDVASLGGENSVQFHLQYGSSIVSLPASSGNGYYVFYAGEAAMNVSLELIDVFYPYGITATTRLSTAGILLDYLAGGKGMAVGKVATQQKALDIASDWRLLFYNADVGAYNDDTTRQDLVSWMHGVDARLTALEKV